MSNILWQKWEKDLLVVGIKKKVVNELGEIVYLDLPKVGQEVKKEDAIALLESNKAAYDIYSPKEGMIVEINKELLSDLTKLNNFPEDEGWLFKIRPAMQ
jgi:glycine cleavage system H protein